MFEPALRHPMGYPPPFAPSPSPIRAMHTRGCPHQPMAVLLSYQYSIHRSQQVQDGHYESVPKPTNTKKKTSWPMVGHRFAAVVSSWPSTLPGQRVVARSGSTPGEWEQRSPARVRRRDFSPKFRHKQANPSRWHPLALGRPYAFHLNCAILVLRAPVRSSSGFTTRS